MSVTYINSPERCDVCKGELNGQFYDASLRVFECWGNVCSGCYARYGKGLGTGLGQHYELQSDGKYYKVGG